MTNTYQDWDWVLSAPEYPGALLACLLAQRGQRVQWHITPSHNLSPVIGVDHQLYRQLGLIPPQWPFAWVHSRLTHQSHPQGVASLEGVLLQRDKLVSDSRREALELGVHMVWIPQQPISLRIVLAENADPQPFHTGLLQGEAGVPGLLECHSPTLCSTYLGQGHHLLAAYTHEPPEQHPRLTWLPAQRLGNLCWEQAETPTLHWPNYPLSPTGLWAESQALMILRRLVKLMAELPPASDWATLAQAYQTQLCQHSPLP